ncbi:cysteine-rich outer membrane protein [Chlamydia vaughanii]|uniref:cysteine-rich outer membrane protein n=1 Tax=Chlamydia vaughanii TaxID=3112552 RepID=UPI0032B1ED62
MTTASGPGNMGPVLDLIQPGLDGVLKDETVQVTLINAALGWMHTNIIKPIRESKIMQSRAFQITMVVLGAVLLIAGVVLTFVLQADLGKNAFLFLIPAVIGLIKLLASSVCMEQPCTPEKWRLCKRFLGTAEDLFDDGQINNSNKIFTTHSVIENTTE